MNPPTQPPEVSGDLPHLPRRFPADRLALSFSFACALLAAFVCLRLVIKIVTREQYNVSDAPRRVSATVWHGDNTPAQPMPEAAAQLAARISSLLPRRTTVSIELQNRTALPPAESSSFRAALEEELRKTGLAAGGFAV